MAVLKHGFKIRKINREKRSRRERKEKKKGNRYIVKEDVKRHQLSQESGSYGICSRFISLVTHLFDMYLMRVRESGRGYHGEKMFSLPSEFIGKGA